VTLRCPSDQPALSDVQTGIELSGCFFNDSQFELLLGVYSKYIVNF
jgi:hypothetical protein